jgi:hypothetical protein
MIFNKLITCQSFSRLDASLLSCTYNIALCWIFPKCIHIDVFAYVRKAIRSFVEAITISSDAVYDVPAIGCTRSYSFENLPGQVPNGFVFEGALVWRTNEKDTDGRSEDRGMPRTIVRLRKRLMVLARGI